MIQEYGSLAEKFLKKGFWLYLFSYILAPIGYIIKIIISGNISVSELGILYGIMSLIILVSAYNDLGMSESLKYFIPKFLEEQDYSKVKTLLVLAIGVQIFTAIIISLIFLFGSEFLAERYFKTEAAVETLKIFSIFFLGYNIIQTISSFFISVQNTLFARLSDFIRMFGTLILILILFFTDTSSLVNFSISQVVGVYIGAFVAIACFYFGYYRKYLSSAIISFKDMNIKKVFSYAFLVVIGASAGTILSQIDMQMIIYLLGTTDAGYYTNYLSIIGIPFMILGPIFGLLVPIIAQLKSKSEYSQIKKIKKVFSNIFITIGIMFSIFFFIFAEVIAFVLFGENFLNSGMILRYSILFIIFNFMLQINYNILAGIGKIHVNVKITSVAMVLNIITNVIFINSIGVYGAALATGLGWLFMFVASQLFLEKRYKSLLNFKNILKNISVLGILGVILFFGLQTYNLLDNRITSLLILGGVFLIWTSVFIGVNYGIFKSFIGDINKLRGKTS